MIPLILSLAFFQTPDTGIPLREGCSADDPQIATVSPADRVEVRQGIAGGDRVCYHIDFIHDGKTISGYVLGESLPAIAAFVADRERVSSQRLEMIAEQAARAAATPPPKPESKEPSAKPAAPVPEIFENFSGRDLRGKPVSLAGMPGRLIVVQFWAPRGSSKQELISLYPLYNQYHRSGLSIVGLAVGVGSKNIGEALDDLTLPFPQIADPGLARRYDVNWRVGKTFVLDQSRRIIASGSAADAMQAVKRFFANPPASAAQTH
jgi:peroxiredoxin